MFKKTVISLEYFFGLHFNIFVKKNTSKMYDNLYFSIPPPRLLNVQLTCESTSNPLITRRLKFFY